MTILVRAELKVRPGKSEEFVNLAGALTEASAAEPGTLRYDWYTSNDPSVFVVIEEYRDAPAALAHNEQCAPRLRQLPELAEMTSVHLHGELGPDLAAWAEANPAAHAHLPLNPDGP